MINSIADRSVAEARESATSVESEPAPASGSGAARAAPVALSCVHRRPIH